MSDTKKADTQRLMQLIVKSSKVTSLAVHAQDHFMNSHILLEMVGIVVEQQTQMKALQERVIKLEQVGETHE